MADIFTKEERSQIMRSIKSSGNKSTELKLINLFKIYKITGWRRKYNLYGKPDFVFLKKRIALFVDGCFWHGHNCRNTRPSNNKKYWMNKINRNVIRDMKTTHYLRSNNWNVIRIKECEIKKNKIIQKLLNALK